MSVSVFTLGCPKCGSLRYTCGSPSGPYDPDKGMIPLFRVDQCLVCNHSWTVDYPKETKKEEKPHA